MLVEKKETQVKTVEVVVSSHRECDKCNQKIERESSFDAFKSYFVIETGQVFPEGGSIERTKLDFCQKCANEILGTLENMGCRSNTKEIEF